MLEQIKFASIGATSYGLSKLNKKWGQNFLINHFSKMPGLPVKISQFLKVKFDVNENELQSSPEPMSLEQVKKIIKSENSILFGQIEYIDPNPMTASIGQVHKVTLKDGRSVAIKVQYPDVSENLESQSRFIVNTMDRAVKSKFDFKVDSYKSYFLSFLNQELHYEQELYNQKLFYGFFSKFKKTIIPKPIPELSTDVILVQEFLESQNNTSDSSDFNYELARFFMHSFFGLGVIHSDLHRNNWGQSLAGDDLIVYDFGSCLRIKPNHIACLIELAEQCESQSYKNLLDLFSQLGFNKKILSKIEDKLPELVQILLEPFVVDKEFDFLTWNLEGRINTLLMDDKWFFRSSGPPWFFIVMRSFSYLTSHFSNNSIKINLKKILIECLESYPLVGAAPNSNLGDFSGVEKSTPISHKEDEANYLSRFLKIEVTEKDQIIIQLEMPARSIINLEDLVPDNVIEHLKGSKVNLTEIKNQALEHNLLPQDLFKASAGMRKYHVWLSN